MSSGNDINSPTINLTSTVGNVGASGNPIYIQNTGTGNAVALTTSASNGSVWVQNYGGSTGNVTVTSSAVGTGDTFSLQYYGGITIASNINTGSGGTLSLQSSNSTIGNASPYILTADTMTLSQGSGSVAVAGNNIVQMAASSGNNLTLSGLATSLTLSTASNITTSSTYTLTTPTVSLTAGSIGTSSNPILLAASNLTANSGGNVYISDSSAATIAGTSTGAIFSLTDTAGGAGSISVSNTITATGALSLLATGTNGGIVLGANVSGTADTIAASGSGAITQSGGAVTGTSSETLTSGSGAIGSLNIATPNVTFNTTGNATLVDSVALTGNGVSTGAVVSLTDNASGGMTINNNVTATGSLSLITSGSTLAIGSGTFVQSTGGTLTVQNTNTSTGTITLGSNSMLLGINGVTVEIGSPTLIAGSTPANVLVTLTGSGAAYFGTNGITASAPTNFVSANNVNVLVSTGSAASTAINLGGGVVINGGQPSIYSLDLTNAPTVSLLTAYQSEGLLGGSLTVGGGIATGGNVIFSTTNSLANLTAENIPTNVTVQFNGFTSSNVVGINITGTSTTSQVIISGTEKFNSTTSAVTTIASNQAGPALSVGSTGLITSDGPLSITVGGDVAISGNITGSSTVAINATGSGTITGSGTVTGTTSLALGSPGNTGAINLSNVVTPNVTFNTTGNVTLVDSQALTATGASTGGNISLTDSAASATALTTSGTITATGTLALLATGTNGGIVLGGNVSGTADTITANGSGTITQTGGTVSGSTSAAFTSGSGAIGSLNIATPVWTANTTGAVTLVDATATTGNGISTGSNISFTDSAASATALTTSGTITATGTLALLATGTNGGIVIGGNVSGTVDTITANGSGTITRCWHCHWHNLCCFH